MPSLLTLLSTIAAAYFSTFIYALIRNLVNARKSGLPYIIVPWDQNHFIWMVASVPLRPFLQRNLPTKVWNRLALTIYGYEFHEKLRPFDEYVGGEKSYVHVGCGRFEFWTRDPEVVAQILGRPRDFVQFELTSLFMGKFGHNVLTDDGDRWARQRKVVAGVINERISKAVFNESIRQTKGLIQELESTSEIDAGTSRLFDMAKKITIHVLSGAGMGASVPWNDTTTEQPKPGFKQTYIQSVKAVVNNIDGPIILPQWFLTNYPIFFPGYQKLKALAYGIEEFPIHTNHILDAERQRLRQDHSVSSRGNIMSQLVQATEQPSNPDMKTEKNKALSDQEMLGNLFVFTAAGYDTTANTISYALVLLARYPKWQDWLFEEIDDILPGQAAMDESLDYATVFPRATRLLAFMLEVLRLFTPLIHISKETATQQTIQASKGRYWLPAKSTVYVNAIALHLDSELWRNLNLANNEEASGQDESQFRPTRWVNPGGSQQPIFQPPKGTFVPWSAGPRICPGQKFAQVEFVTVFLTLLREHKISAVPLETETPEDVDRRLDMRMKDSMSVLTLQMNGVYDSNDQGLMLKLSKR